MGEGGAGRRVAGGVEWRRIPQKLFNGVERGEL